MQENAEENYESQAKNKIEKYQLDQFQECQGKLTKNGRQISVGTLCLLQQEGLWNMTK